MPQYQARDIEVLSGLDPVRKRPGMYTDTTRPNHLVQEVVDNSVDEAIAGFAKKISVILHADGAITVEDDGRGMPTDMHPEEGVSGVEVILTRLHSGGKFSGKNYTFSGGLHGVGVSVVNALSETLEVWIKRDGKEHYMNFAGGEKVSDLQTIAEVGGRNTGTRVKFVPETNFFDSSNISVLELKHNLQAKAVLLNGLKLELKVEKTAETFTWLYEKGLDGYLLETIGDNEYIPSEVFAGSSDKDELKLDWALVWLPTGSELTGESYVNLVPTKQGGTHVNGLRSGLTESIREFCDFRKLVSRGIKISPDDVWDKVMYILSVKMQDPQFAGQTKERLSSRAVAALVASRVQDAFSLWLNQHPDQGEQIAELAISSAQNRMRKAKKVKRKKISSGPALPGKLADCTSNDLQETEIFLVEGDSAGGSAKQARDRETQAIMPLRGKILNSWEVDPSEVLSSQEVHDIAIALGISPGSDDDLGGMRYGKVCILADADSDGAHIATLLCALFLRHFKKLVENGHVFVAMPPLYRIDAGKDVFYALDEDEKTGIVAKIKNQNRKVKLSVQRFKGLGEMNPAQLRETTMHPDSRRLVRLMVAQADNSNEVMDMLLSKKRAADRKNWLEQNGDLAVIES